MRTVLGCLVAAMLAAGCRPERGWDGKCGGTGDSPCTEVGSESLADVDSDDWPEGLADAWDLWQAGVGIWTATVAEGSADNEGQATVEVGEEVSMWVTSGRAGGQVEITNGTSDHTDLVKE